LAEVGAPQQALDPPLPNRTTRISEPSAAVVAQDNRNLILLAIVAAILGAGAFVFHHTILGSVLGAFALLCIIGVFSKKSLVGQCPYWMATFRSASKRIPPRHRCENCSEYSAVADKTLRPLDPNTTASQIPEFEAPVFKSTSFPNTCAACGAPATRVDQVQASKTDRTMAALSAARLAHSLATGSPAALLFRKTQASITVPYCSQHKDAVELKIVGNKTPVLVWSSLRMMRRYLAANRGREKH